MLDLYKIEKKMARTPILTVSNTEKARTAQRNSEAERYLDLQNSPEMRSVTRHFTVNLEEARIDLVGPLPNGSSVLRVTAKPINGDKVIKAHVEINLNENEVIEFMMREEFYRNLSSLKLSQFTGYVAEQKIMDLAIKGDLFDVGYVKTAGRRVAPSFRTIIGQEKRIVDGKIWAIQNDSGHGIDFLCEVSPYPPAPKYITMDAKATLRADYGNYATPNGPPLSDVQKNPLTNLQRHLENAVESFESGKNQYRITDEQYDNFMDILEDLRRPGILEGYKVTIGLTNGFNIAGNAKYPDNMIIFSRIV